jgi:hypothetical protein
MEFTDEQFAQVLSSCDASVARMGEAFFDPEISEHLQPEMINLLQDARRAWV